MDVICVLPARLSSTRISRKPLVRIAGRPLLEWAWLAAAGIPRFDRVVVATDSEEIESAARTFDAEVVMTSPDHASGTDRVEEAAETLGAGDEDVVVNFQGDEPFVDGATVEAAVRAIEEADGGIDVSTLAAPIEREDELVSPAIVKVARAGDGTALYFSRSPIPYCRADDGESGATARGLDGALRHIGVYACRRPALRRWAGLPVSRLEAIEKLEQLRALEAHMRIHVEVGPATEPGIDVPADLERAERVLTGAGRR